MPSQPVWLYQGNIQRKNHMSYVVGVESLIPFQDAYHFLTCCTSWVSLHPHYFEIPVKNKYTSHHGREKTAIFTWMSDHTRKSRWNWKVHTAWISIKKNLCKLMSETPPPALVGLFYNPRSKQLEFFGPHFMTAIMTKELRSNFVCLASLTLSNFVQMGFSQLISCQTFAFSRCTFIYI